MMKFVRPVIVSEGLENSLHTLTLGGRESNSSLCSIFQVDILY
jgi:hypothetical protein